MTTRPRTRGAALVLGGAIFAFYLSTLAPSLVWADGGRLQIDALTGGSLYWHFDELSGVATDGWPFDRLGVAAWDHPLWVMLGHAVVALPFGDPAWLLNLLSAIPAALTCVVLFTIVVRLTGDVWGAAAGAIALAVSHTFWFHAVTAEVYALHALFMLALIGMVLSWTELTPRRLAVGALVAGLGLANHLMLALTVIPLALFAAVRHQRRRRATGSRRLWLDRNDIRRALLFFAVGFAPWWVQFARMSVVGGVAATASIAAGFPWLGERWPGPPGELLANTVSYLGMLVYQFTPVGCAAGVYGAWWLWRRRRGETLALLALFCLHAAFSANYQVADRFAFHLPSFVIFAVFVGCGVAGVVARLRAASEARELAGRHHAGRRATDTHGTDGQGINVQGINVQGIEIQRTDVQRTDVQGIDIQRIDVQGTDPQSTDIQRASAKAPVRREDPRAEEWRAQGWDPDILQSIGRHSAERHGNDVRHDLDPERSGRHAIDRLERRRAVDLSAMGQPPAGRHSMDHTPAQRPPAQTDLGRHSTDRLARRAADRGTTDRGAAGQRVATNHRNDGERGDEEQGRSIDLHPVGKHRVGLYAAARRRAAGVLAIVVMAAPVAIYALVPGYLRASGITDADMGIPTVGVAGRDGIAYFLDPNQRGDDSAARFGQSALDALAPNALVLLAWPVDLEPYIAMRYYQLTQQRRTDVTLDLMLFTGTSPQESVLAITAAQRDCRPLYLASDDADIYPIEQLRRDFTLVTQGHLVRLQPKRKVTRTCPAPAPASVGLADLMRRVRR